MYSHASSCVHMSLPVFERSWICTWLFLAVLGCTWLYLAVPGCTWLYLTVHGCTWLYLAMAMVCLGLFQITIWRVDGWMELWILVLIKPNIHWTGFFWFLYFLVRKLAYQGSRPIHVLDRKKSAFSILLLINSNCSHVGHTSQKSNMSQDANTRWRKMTFDKSQCVNLSHLHIVRAKNIATFGFME